MKTPSSYKLDDIEIRELREKIKNELRFKETVSQLSGVINSLPDIIFYKNTNGEYINCNKAFENYFNIKEHSIIGKTDREIFPEELAVIISDSDSSIVKSKQPTISENTFLKPDGTNEYLEIIKMPFIDASDNLLGVIGVARIITGRKEIEEALRKSEEQYRQLIDTMNEGVAILNGEGVMTYVNSKFCEMLRYEREEVINKTTFDFIDSNKPLTMTSQISENVNGSEKYYEMEWLRKDGTKLITFVSPSEISDDDGKLSGRLVILTDITLLKDIENELNQKNYELKETLDNLKSTQAQLVDSEKMASLGQLTAGIAHEINNPINYVAGNISPLKLDLKDLKKLIAKFRELDDCKNINDKIEEIKELRNELDIDFLFEEIDNLLKGIDEGAKRTKDIVSGLRIFSRLDESDFKQADIHEGIDSTLILLNNKLKNRIKVIKEFATMPKIECLPGKLNQVFMNILNNSAQAIEGEGEILIKTKMIDDNVIISIKDNGPGIPEKVKKHIFEPFFTTKDVGSGTGLGLPITLGIIENHDGKIEVNSSPGEGSEFVITLPRYRKNKM